VSKNLQSLLLAVIVVIGSGVATWLFLPMTVEPVEQTRIPDWVFQVVIESIRIGPIAIGPIQAGHLLLVIVLIAAGAPFAGLVMGLIVRWLSRIVPTDAPVTSAPAAKSAARPAAVAASTEEIAEAETPLRQRLVWWGAIVAAIGAIVFLIIQVLPPGFTLF